MPGRQLQLDWLWSYLSLLRVSRKLAWSSPNVYPDPSHNSDPLKRRSRHTPVRPSFSEAQKCIGRRRQVEYHGHLESSEQTRGSIHAAWPSAIVRRDESARNEP